MNYRMLLTRAVLFGLSTAGFAYGAVINPGFETGNFTGWTRIGDLGFTAVTGPSSPNCGGIPLVNCATHSGSFAAFFGNTTLGGITQSLATVPGTTYSVDFWLAVDVDGTGPGGTEYKVSWNSTILTDVFNAPIAPAWRHLSFSAVAGGPTSVLKFEFANSPDTFGLDDVSVTAAALPAVPEPVSSILAGTSLIALAGLRRMLRRSRG